MQRNGFRILTRSGPENIIAVCDIWGCQLSRVIDSYEMFTEFAEGRIGDHPEEE